MLQLQGPKNNFWLLTADNAGALTVYLSDFDTFASLISLVHLKKTKCTNLFAWCQKKNIFASVSKSSSLKYCSHQMSQAAFSFVFYFKVRFLALNFHTLPKVLLRYFLVARGNSKKDILLIFCTYQIVQWLAEKLDFLTA